MTGTEPSRRAVLKAGAALTGTVTLLAGCTDDATDTGTGTTPGDAGDPMGLVPDGAESVLQADVATVLSDDGVRTLSNALFEVRAESTYYEGPADLEEALDRFEDESGLAPGDVSEAVGFWEYSQSSSVSDQLWGAIVETDWAEEDLVDAFEENGNPVDDDEYEGATVYEPDQEGNAWAGVLGDGRYVVGTRDAVEEVIDVKRGEEDRLESHLREGYEGTRDGLLRFSSEIPGSYLPTSTDDSPVDYQVFRHVEVAAGAVYAEGDTRGLEVTFRAEDEDAATDVADVVDGLASFVRGSTDNETVAAILEAVDVERDGTDVTVTYEATIDELAGYIDEFTGSQQPVDRTPQASFAFEHDRDANTLTILHQGGDSIPAESLYITGEGFDPSVSGVDQSGPGRWQGSTGDGYVRAGDSVTLGVQSTHEVRILYRGDETTAVLAAYGSGSET